MLLLWKQLTKNLVFGRVGLTEKGMFSISFSQFQANGTRGREKIVEFKLKRLCELNLEVLKQFC